MIKDNIYLPAIGLALLVIVTGCASRSINNTNAANSNSVRSGNTLDGNSGAHTLSSPAAAPSPGNSMKTVQVRLAVVETNADLIDSPLPDSKVIVKSGETTLNKLTNAEGVVVFDSVPCSNEIVITARDEENDEETILNHKLECRETQVDLGVIVKPFGGKFILEQRQPQFIEYDPIKNEWRSKGKVVPNERIRGILGKYM